MLMGDKWIWYWKTLLDERLACPEVNGQYRRTQWEAHKEIDRMDGERFRVRGLVQYVGDIGPGAYIRAMSQSRSDPHRDNLD